ncbi:MAG: hypothetical protein AAGA11_18465, partial [Pseudomonadota bacterium]
MNVDANAIDSPLAMIALFVVMIELFLLYPIAKLEGRDRSRLVLFIIGYPVFIALSFFILLWNRPIHLYTPQTLDADLRQSLLPEKLDKELASDRVTLAAMEIKLAELENSISTISETRIEKSDPNRIPESNATSSLADIERLKSDLLSRIQADNDLSGES